jgi:transcriptional regulator with XRE-family HTH domain
MSINEAATLAKVAKRRTRDLGLTQEDIALALGISQSQVSRVLSGRSGKRSKLLDRICKYAFRANKGVSLQLVRETPELIEALASTWDGTPAHSAALAAVIRSLSVLRPPPDE